MPSRLKLPFLVFVVTLIAGLAGCAGTPSTGGKVAMHIGDVLDFAVEYPQDWTKQKTFDRRRAEGRVSWSANPEEQGAAITLSIDSLVSMVPTEAEQEVLDRLQQEAPNFTLSDRQGIDLPAGPALRLQGFTPQRVYAVYILLTD